MTPQRVGLVITDLEPGGAELCLTELAVRLDRKRFEPIVYCLGPEPVAATRKCLSMLEQAGVRTHFLNARGSRHFPATVFRLRRRLHRDRPSLVQSFLFHANIVCRIAARWSGIPWVVSGIRVAEREKRWHLRVDRITTGMVDRYVSVSEAVARFSAERGRLSRGRIVVIPNGIDVSRYPCSAPVDLRQLGLPPGRRAITYIGRLELQKGLDWFLSSAGRWLDRLPQYDLVLVGKGEQQPALERICRNAGISSRVHFVGWRPDASAILAASQALVLPSRWEGMPNVVLEAMASRLPVLATDVEGVRELLGEMADAQTAPYGDAEAAAEKLVWIFSDPALAQELGAKNRARAEARFGIDKMVAEYGGLWESLMD